MNTIDIEFEETDSSDMTSDPYSDSSYTESDESISDLSSVEEGDFVSLSQELRENEEMFKDQAKEEEEILLNEDDRKRKYGIDPEGKYYLNPDDLNSISYFEELHKRDF